MVEALYGANDDIYGHEHGKAPGTSRHINVSVEQLGYEQYLREARGLEGRLVAIGSMVMPVARKRQMRRDVGTASRLNECSRSEVDTRRCPGVHGRRVG